MPRWLAGAVRLGDCIQVKRERVVNGVGRQQTPSGCRFFRSAISEPFSQICESGVGLLAMTSPNQAPAFAQVWP